MKALQLGGLAIGPGQPVVVVAEAACEHLGSLELALRMVDAAKLVGVDIVKFQHHLPCEMLPQRIRFWGGSMDEVVARYSLTLKEHARLLDYCTDVGLTYLCTPFSAEAVTQLGELGVSGFKFGSGELTNVQMFTRAAAFDRPLIVSTGMSTLTEVDAAVDVLQSLGCDFMLTNCTSEYPPRFDHINLGLIELFAKRYDVPIGHSDHTPTLWTAIAAVAKGACLVEKHFTLSRALKGPDAGVSLEPAELGALVEGVRAAEAALGSEKRVFAEEALVREWARHSVVTVRDVSSGEVLDGDAVTVRRPGGGISAAELERVVGRRAARDLKHDELVQWSDLR